MYYQQNSYIISILRKLDDQKISNGTARSNSSSIQIIIYICSRHDDKVTSSIQIIIYICSRHDDKVTSSIQIVQYKVR